MNGWGKKTIWLLALWAGLFWLGPIPASASQFTNSQVPIFQFEVFYYDGDMEITPGPNMGYNGAVHGNKDIYLSPGATLVFSNPVTTAGSIFMHRKAGDPSGNGSGTTIFMNGSATNVAPYFLPASFTNFSTAHGVIDTPYYGESANSATGTNRLYNQVDMIVVVSNSSITVKSGVLINDSVTHVTNYAGWLTTNGSFWNVREAATIKNVTIDVGKLRTWSASNSSNVFRSLMPGGARDISSIFIADMRTMASTNQPGIVLTNGAYLPSNGLAVISPDPVYIVGDYNTTDDGVTFHPGSADTTHTKPAAIMCDAFNVLSGAWNPTNSTNTLANRVAGNTTVNAAILSGIVPTTSGYFSGGVENYPRFHESWTGKTFTFNGCMVEFFSSQIAIGPWLSSGTAYNSYNAPMRSWSFDANFLNSAKLPPLTPLLIATAPIILSGPSGTNNGVFGQSFTFSVVATNYLTNLYPLSYTYQWYFNTNTLLTGATNSTLTLTNLQTNQAGMYNVTVRNSAAATNSAYGKLVINFAPTITTQPQDAYVLEAHTNVFTVQAAGTPPFHYQWYKTTIDIYHSTTNTTTVGSSTNALSVTALPADDPYYKVVVTNLYGSVTSTPALLLTIYPPHVDYLSNIVVNLGQPASFRIYPSGVPGPDLRWYKNGVLLASGNPSIVFSNAQSGIYQGTNLVLSYVITNAILSIPSTTLADAGTYTVIGSNMVGTASSSVTLTVGNPPAFTNHPTNTTVECGGSVSLTAAATAQPAGTYQWYLFTNRVAGGTNATLVLNSVATTNAGDYSLVVSNALGTVTSSNATLTVTHLVGPTISVPSPFTTNAADLNGTAVAYAPTASDACDGTLSVVCDPASGSMFPPGTNTVTATAIDSGGNSATNSFLVIVQTPPVILSNPNSLTVMPGELASFTAVASGFPAPDFYWLKNGNLTGNTGSTLSFISAALSDAGTYSVMVSNAVGSVTSATAILAVGAIPTLTQQPTNLTVECGGSGILTAAALMQPAGTYQWYLFTNPVAGGTNVTLIFNSVATTNAGDYLLVVSNALGTVTSSNATLTVTHLVGPTIAVPSPISLMATDQSGAVVTFAPTASDACDGALSVICDPASGSIFPAGTNTVTATATDSGGNSATNTFLVVVALMPPVITTNPVDQAASVGQSVSFTAAASGLSAPMIYWLKNGVATGNTGGTLLLTNITVADAGTYSVIASNLGGSATSSGAVLTVAKADSSTTLAPLISSATVQPVTFAATVVSPAGTPTGQVAFKDGTNSLGLVPLLSGGATLSGVSLTAGEHAITAVYSGDDNFNASTATGRQRLGFFLLTPGGQPDGGFSLLGSGNPGQTSILELTDLTAFPWQWTPVDTNTADTNGVFHFSQPGGTNEGARLYRLRWPGP